jgi:hypothetical protein
VDSNLGPLKWDVHKGDYVARLLIIIRNAFVQLVNLDHKDTFRIVKLPGLVVNFEDSQSEPWSLDLSSIPGFA